MSYVKILICGNGFFAKSIKKYFSLFESVEIFCLTRKELNFLNFFEVVAWFEKIKPDVVINCVVVGGKYHQPDTVNVLYENILTYSNIMSASQETNSFIINFGSGAEIDRKMQNFELQEKVLLDIEMIPKDYYGLSKNIISKMHLNFPSVYFRVFGSFGEEDKKERFLISSIIKCKQNQDIFINENKIMDFFYIKDLCKMIHYFIFNQPKSNKIIVNAVYEEKYKINEIIEIIKKITKSKSKVCYSLLTNSYIGECGVAKTFYLDGLFKGLEKTCCAIN